MAILRILHSICVIGYIEKVSQHSQGPSEGVERVVEGTRPSGSFQQQSAFAFLLRPRRSNQKHQWQKYPRRPAPKHKQTTKSISYKLHQHLMGLHDTWVDIGRRSSELLGKVSGTAARSARQRPWSREPAGNASPEPQTLSSFTVCTISTFSCARKFAPSGHLC